MTPDDIERDTYYADEGTVAHRLAEICLKEHKDPMEFLGCQFHGYPEIPVDKEMATHVRNYIDLIGEFDGDSTRFIEHTVEYDNYVPDGFGTPDITLINPDIVIIDDFKYGQNDLVTAENNPQLLLAALGVFQSLSYIEDIKNFRLIIYQPRMLNTDVWEITLEELLAWVEKEVKPAVDRILSDDPPFNPGPTQCKYCPAKASCKAYAEYNLSLIAEEFEDFESNVTPFKLPEPNTLSRAQRGQILTLKPQLKKWLSEIYELSKKEKEDGFDIPGNKLVLGNSKRQWKDKIKAQRALQNAGLKINDIVKKELISPARAEKLIGKNHNVLKNHAITHEGGLLLVPDSNRRKEVEPMVQIEEEFKDVA